MSRNGVMVAALACVVLVGLAGCTKNNQDQKSSDKLCVQVAKLDGTVTQIASVAASNGPVAQIKTLKATMQSQYKDVQSAAKKVLILKTDALSKAYNDVLTSTNAVTDQASLAAAQPAIDKAAGEFSDARTDLNNFAHC